MAAASLLDLGADERVLRATLNSLPVDGFEIEVSRVKKAGLDVCDFNVILDASADNHDHDMEYLYGHERDQEHVHEHNHEHGIYHEHEHDHGHGSTHSHRTLADIENIIGQASMTPRAKETTLRIFRVLAEAEARAHGVEMEEVHFHEVGAVDSIVDIVTVAVCLDMLDITQVIVPYLCEGWGSVRCQHGILPIPVPAVTNIVAENGLNLRRIQTKGELVTPTGAAIVAGTFTDDVLPETYTIQDIGMGAGKREYETPGILRAMLIEAVA
jgi:hypothetical protein